MNTKNIGDRSEAQVLAAFLRAGKVVLQPFGDNCRYDLVVDENGIFERVQVKTGRVQDGLLRADICSSYAHRGRGKKDYRGDADLFAIYCPQLDKIYIVPVADAGRATIHLRINPAKNGQKSNIRFAKDYEFNSRVAQ